MILKTIEREPMRALQYMERYVNDGSPSGFTEMYRPSPPTDPLGFTPWYHPFCITAQPTDMEVFGYVPNLLPAEEELGSNWFIVHPDMVDHPDLSKLQVRQLSSLRVIPTSSGRTVQVFGLESADYIKLHYDGILGRVDRKLPREKVISGPEVSRYILEAIEQNRLPEQLCIFHETGAKILYIDNGPHRSTHWGLVWRESRPRGARANLIFYLIPLFALWSIDRLRPYDPPILEVICKILGNHATTYLIEGILFPILDSYFELLNKLGFQMELNAQNILVGFDANWVPVAVIIRDMMGTEKDLTLRGNLSLPCDFESAPYKCISEEEPSLYRIRHSFAFDFKLGMYVLDPIVRCASMKGYLMEVDITKMLKEHSKKWIKKLPEDFFPEEGKWYRHDRVLLTQKRGYVAESNPKYR